MCNVQSPSDPFPADDPQLPLLTDSRSAGATSQQTSAPGHSGQSTSGVTAIADGVTGAWTTLRKRVSRRAEGRERSSPAQFRRHGPFQKAALPSVLWTLDPADDGGELVAGVEAEAINAAKAIAAAARELASRTFGIEL